MKYNIYSTYVYSELLPPNMHNWLDIFVIDFASPFLIVSCSFIIKTRTFNFLLLFFKRLTTTDCQNDNSAHDCQKWIIALKYCSIYFLLQIKFCFLYVNESQTYRTKIFYSFHTNNISSSYKKYLSINI